MAARLLAGLAGVALARATELTPETWDAAVAGKTVFVKFLAPWWGHCKSMKPAWDALMKKYEGHATALVADVDCTAEGKPLCDSNGVQGFPSIKWGDPSALEDYEGGRDEEALEKFAEENLKPICSPSNIDLCDDEKKKQIQDLMAMDGKALQAKIDEKEAESKAAEEFFEAEVKKLQETYEGLEKQKTEKQAEVKASGLGLMKAVMASKKGKDEL